MGTGNGDLSPEISSWLQSVAKELFPGSAGQARIEVERTITREEARLYFCRMSLAGSSSRLCIKEFTQLTSDTVESLYQRSRHFGNQLLKNGVRLPSFVAVSPSLRSIAMTVEEGESLEALIIRSLFPFRGAVRQRCLAAIRNLATIMTRLHTLPVDSEVRMPQPCSNREYSERIGKYVEDPFVVECLSRNGASPQDRIRRLPSGFRDRHVKSLLHGDFQAKNVLVANDGSVTLLDMEFAYGHPLFDVAQFLTQLIRLNRLWRLPGTSKLLGRYGDQVLSSYLGQDAQGLAPDLPFFMIWSSTFSLLSDAGHPKVVRAYIKHHLQTSDMAQRWGLFGPSSR